MLRITLNKYGDASAKATLLEGVFELYLELDLNLRSYIQIFSKTDFFGKTTPFFERGKITFWIRRMI